MPLTLNNSTRKNSLARSRYEFFPRIEHDSQKKVTTEKPATSHDSDKDFLSCYIPIQIACSMQYLCILDQK